MRIKDRFSNNEKDKESTTVKVKKEVKNELIDEKKQIIKQSKRIKNLWKTKEIIQLKTDSIAILWKKKGKEDEFFAEFDKITKEGYHMVGMESVKAIDVGPINMQIGYYYYFQHRDFIK